MLSSEMIMSLSEAISQENDCDIYFYNGNIQRGDDLEFIQLVHKNRQRKNASLILVTMGGDPDAAYKMARYIQNNYEQFTLIVPGMCKSAGTLIAVGAHCVAFAAYGELGPIDIQTYKIDNLAERQSGLTITESLEHLSRTAIITHGRVFGAIMDDTQAIISFKTAAEASAQLVTGLFAPIFSQIDPMEVGEKSRSMRIASDYGRRLNAQSKNLQSGALENLTQTYPSHSFVIDLQEAQGLFENVRKLSEKEQQLVEALRAGARHQLDTIDGEPAIFCLTMTKDGNDDESTDRPGSSSGNGEDSARTIGAPDDGSREIPADPGQGRSPERKRKKSAKADSLIGKITQ